MNSQKEKESTTTDLSTPHVETVKKGEAETSFFIVLIHFAFSVLENWVLFSSLSEKKPVSLWIVGGAIGFPFMFYISLIDWGRRNEIQWCIRAHAKFEVLKQRSGSLAWFLTKVAFWFCVVCLCAWAGIAFVGWLGTIPVWAAVIIVLLILK